MEKMIKSNITIIVNLEYLGIRFEDTKEEYTPNRLTSKTVYYYSVPESSTLEVENEALNEKIKTANDLKHLAKDVLVDMLLDNCKSEFGEKADEFVSDVKNNLSDYFKFCAKVRKGEIWSKELAEQRIKELGAEIDKVTGYMEV